MKKQENSKTMPTALPSKTELRDDIHMLSLGLLATENDNRRLGIERPKRQPTKEQNNKVVYLNIFEPNTDSRFSHIDFGPVYTYGNYKRGIAATSVEKSFAVAGASLAIAELLLHRIALIETKALRGNAKIAYSQKIEFYSDQLEDRVNSIIKEADFTYEIFNNSRNYKIETKNNIAHEDFTQVVRAASTLLTPYTLDMMCRAHEADTMETLERKIKYNTIKLATECISNAAEAYRARAVCNVKAIKAYDAYQNTKRMSSRDWHALMDRRSEFVHDNIKDIREARWMLLLGQSEIAPFYSDNNHPLLGHNKNHVIGARDFMGYQALCNFNKK